MAANLFSAAGYFIGEDLLPAGPGNANGYFESREVIAINEDLLDQVIPLRPAGRIGWRLHSHRPIRRSQRWAVRPRRSAYELRVSPELARRMRRQASSPFCLKDPRFCWTLPAWRAVLGEPVYVCMFRHPAQTIDSIIEHGQRPPALPDYMLRRGELAKVWRDMYANILRWAGGDGGDWVFLEYDDVLRDHGIVERLGARVDARLDPELVQRSIRSVGPDESVPGECQAVYAELRARSSRGVALTQNRG
jgi:hypothetical protein